MAEFRSKVGRARPTTTSLRTTIPIPVARMMGLQNGDILVWDVEPKGDKVVVTVSKETS